MTHNLGASMGSRKGPVVSRGVSRETLATRLREARAAKRWTQAELAQKAGVHKNSVQRWESGETPLDAQLRAAAQALEVSMRWLETGEGEPTARSFPVVGEGRLDYTAEGLTLTGRATAEVGDTPNARLALAQGAIANVEAAMRALKQLRGYLDADLRAAEAASDAADAGAGGLRTTRAGAESRRDTGQG